MNEDEKTKLTAWQEIKRFWIVFVVFGLLSAAISAGISTYVSTKVIQGMQGPTCRIDFSEEKFQWNPSTDFKLPFLFINLIDKELLIESFDGYCYWPPPGVESNKKNEDQAINPPIIKEISIPKELEKFPASQSEAKIIHGCRSPSKEGLYKIRIIAKTTQGSCQGEVLMEVKK